jgi:AraC-like DNA-binding protein
MLSVAKAARVLGISRRKLQRQMEKQGLATFEGAVSISELFRVYPEMEARLAEKTENSRMRDRVKAIQEAALLHGYGHEEQDVDILESRLKKIRLALLHSEEEKNIQTAKATTTALALNQAEAKAEHYLQVIEEMNVRLLKLKSCCNNKQKASLSQMIDWLSVETRH